MRVIKRNGQEVEFDKQKIIDAMTNAFMETEEGIDEDLIQDIADEIEEEIGELVYYPTVESIQDMVEEALMSSDRKDVAKKYIVYRNMRAEDRMIEDKRLFISEYKNASNASTGSKFDANANVDQKNIATLNGELYKRENIMLNRKILKDKIETMFGHDVAQQYIKDLKSHILYKHDETSIMPYCVAISMNPFLHDGLKKLGGHSNPPTHLQSFNGSFINLVFAIASQFAGAVATPEYLLYMDYFIRKDYGQDYYLETDKIVDSSTRGRTINKVIEDSFQQVVYSLNQPAAARSYQSIFWNIGYFDKYYFDSIFGGFMFPDGTKPNWDSLNWLQKKFMKWFNKERLKSVLTFPVETMALLTENGDVKDKEYKDFTAEMYSEGHSFFTYMSESADSLSSCCFDGKQKVLLKSSNGVHHITFDELANTSYDKYKKNMTIFHNGSWCKGKLVKAQSEELYKITTTNNKTIIVTKDHINPTINGDIISEKLTTNDYLQFSNIELNEYPEKDLKLTYEQGILIGSYLGDGSIEQKKESFTPTIHFSLNENKYANLLPHLERALQQMNISGELNLNKQYNNVYPVYVASQELKNFIKTWTRGEYSHEKELNLDCLMQCVEFRKGILDGYYMTDGGNSNRIYTTSQNMVEQLEVLITSLGKVSIVDISDRTDEPVVIREETYKRNFPLYCIRWYDSKNKRSMGDIYKVRNNSTFFRIKEIDKITDKRDVYCFEMNNQDEQYFTLPNGIITHNCRLRNEISNDFSFSLGAGGVATGSKSVMTININRLVQNLSNSGQDISEGVRQKVKDIHKYQIAYNELIKDYLKAGLLPVYDAKFIFMEKQFLTIGINGLVESAEFLGINPVANNPEYKEYINSILKPIYEENLKIKEQYDDIMFNTEFVPAENLGVKNANWDRQDGYFVPRDCYNSYFYKVEDIGTNVIDKFILHGKDSIQYLDGRK